MQRLIQIRSHTNPDIPAMLSLGRSTDERCRAATTPSRCHCGALTAIRSNGSVQPIARISRSIRPDCTGDSSGGGGDASGWWCVGFERLKPRKDLHDFRKIWAIWDGNQWEKIPSELEQIYEFTIFTCSHIWALYANSWTP
ncbi:Uncharacterized protein Fot_23620 [Forsythia ovata]|uniref:Uncharacterized protein n=1 Tax=Forsythia ovata TaxID=205694 RepID=A0ABD1V133_9LAMI